MQPTLVPCGEDGQGPQPDYLSRGEELEIETDDGQRFSGEGVEKELL